LKTAQVAVPADLIAAHGAVSPEVAAAMARGGLDRSGADHCLSITGIAGPEGGSRNKPVGTVYVALASRSGTTDVRHFRMAGDRVSIREWSARSALAILRLHLSGNPGVRLLRQAD
jgi:PncC family amidohydrolase